MARRTWRRFGDDPFGADPSPDLADILSDASPPTPPAIPAPASAPADAPEKPQEAPEPPAEPEVPEGHDPTPEEVAQAFAAHEEAVQPDAVSYPPVDPSKGAPQDLEAEVSVLGAMLLDPSVVGPVLEEVEETDFYRESHRKLLRAMTCLHDETGTIDVVLLRDNLKKAGDLDAVGGPEALVNIMDRVPTSTNAVEYAKVVRRKARLRDAIVRADRIVRAAMHDEAKAETVLHEAARDFEELAEQSLRGRLPKLVGMGDLMAMDIPLPVPIIGDQTPTALFSKSQFALVVGPPKLGKSALLQDLIEGLVRPGATWVGQKLHGPKRILLVPKEGGLALLKGRLISMGSRVDAAYANNCMILPDSDARRFRLDDRRSVALLRRIIEENQIDLFILDPMAKFHQGDENSNKEMAPIVDAIYEVRTITEAACILVHHQAKMPHEALKGQGGIRARGASVIFADTDACWTIEPPDDPKNPDAETFQMFTEARWCEKPPGLLVWRQPDFTHRHSPMGSMADERGNRRQPKFGVIHLNELLNREKRWLEVREIAMLAGVSDQTIRRAIEAAGPMVAQAPPLPGRRLPRFGLTSLQKPGEQLGLLDKKPVTTDDDANKEP